jgi:hypothetical protein
MHLKIAQSGQVPRTPGHPATAAGNRINRRATLLLVLGATATIAGAGLALSRPEPAALAARSLRAAWNKEGATGDDDSVVTAWNSAALDVIRTSTYGSPIVARALAIMHTCMYDAWAAYDALAAGTRLGDTLRRPSTERTVANKAEAVSYAAYRALLNLFPSEATRFARLLTSMGYDPRDASTDTRTARGVGNVAAQAVLNFRRDDGANQFGDLHRGAYSDYTGYRPVNTPYQVIEPNRWQPLRVPDGHGGFVVQRWTTPHWGRVIPFAMTAGAQFRPASGPVLYPSAQFREQALQILQYSAVLTDEQKVIAEYWADDAGTERHPGHWCHLAQMAAARDRYDLDANVKLFFVLTNALLDAGIAAYDAKRAFDAVRPITAIHYLFGGRTVRAWAGPHRGTGLLVGRDWLPYQVATVVTPAFPEYVSAHSTFSAAAAEALKRVTGGDAFGASATFPAGTSLIEPGTTPKHPVTLTWPTFSAAADQIGMPRRYGGIHFAAADLAGRSMGRQIGAQAWARAQCYFMGSAFAPHRA